MRCFQAPPSAFFSTIKTIWTRQSRQVTIQLPDRCVSPKSLSQSNPKTPIQPHRAFASKSLSTPSTPFFNQLRLLSSSANNTKTPQTNKPPQELSQQVDAQFIARVNADPYLKKFKYSDLIQKISPSSQSTFIDFVKLKQEPFHKIFLGTGFFLFIFTVWMHYNSILQLKKSAQGPQLILDSCLESTRRIIQSSSDLTQPYIISPKPPSQSAPNSSEITGYLEQVQLYLLQDYQFLFNESRNTKHQVAVCSEQLQHLLVLLNCLQDLKTTSTNTSQQLCTQIQTLKDLIMKDLHAFTGLKEELDKYSQNSSKFEESLFTTTESHIKLITAAATPSLPSFITDTTQCRNTTRDPELNTDTDSLAESTAPTLLQIALINQYIEPLCKAQHQLRQWSTINLFFIIHLRTIIENYTRLAAHIVDIADSSRDIVILDQPSEIEDYQDIALLSSTFCNKRFDDIIHHLNFIHLPHQSSYISPASPSTVGDSTSIQTSLQIENVELSFPSIGSTPFYEQFFPTNPSFQYRETFFHFSSLSNAPAIILRYFQHLTIPALESCLPYSVLSPNTFLLPAQSSFHPHQLSTYTIPSKLTNVVNSFSDISYSTVSRFFRQYGHLGAQLPLGEYIHDYFISIYDFWNIRYHARFDPLDPITINTYQILPTTDGEFYTNSTIYHDLDSFNQMTATTTSQPSHIPCTNSLHFPTTSFINSRLTSPPDWTDGGHQSLHMILQMNDKYTHFLQNTSTISINTSSTTQELTPQSSNAI